MITYFGSQISPNKVETSEGFLICRNVPIARIGEQTYLRRELQLDGDPEATVSVHRYDTDVFDKAALASFEGKPVTDGHPADSVGPENFSSLAKGHIQNVRREDHYIMADLYINDASLISDIQNNVKREVSCGYMCNYEPDGDTDYKQTHIRGNHVAVVQSGRAGHEVAIKDAAAKAEGGTQLMSKFATSVLTAFGIAAKDAKEDELKALTDLASVALESEPAEHAQEEAPATESEDEMKEKESDGDDLGTKLDKVIEMLSAVLKKEVTDEEAEKPEDEEETKDEDALAEAIDELEEVSDESSEVVEDEEAEETADCDVSASEAKDAAAFLKVIQPVVAGIKDKNDRANVSAAILKAMKTADGKWNSIFAATHKAASKAADASGKTSYEKRCEVQTSAYASRNPHMKKEEK